MRRPRFALPFTVLTGPDTVRLIAGEDFRYTLTGPGLEEWLPDLLASFDGRRLIGELTARLEARLREPAAQMVDRLYGERVLVDGPAEDAHRERHYTPTVEGVGALADRLAATVATGSAGTARLPILCQDRLDYDERSGSTAATSKALPPGSGPHAGP